MVLFHGIEQHIAGAPHSDKFRSVTLTSSRSPFFDTKIRSQTRSIGMIISGPPEVPQTSPQKTAVMLLVVGVGSS